MHGRTSDYVPSFKILSSESRPSPPPITRIDSCRAVLQCTDEQHALLLSFGRLQRAPPLGQHVRVHNVARCNYRSVTTISQKKTSRHTGNVGQETQQQVDPIRQADTSRRRQCEIHQPRLTD
jgi:hypothetical protein